MRPPATSTASAGGPVAAVPARVWTVAPATRSGFDSATHQSRSVDGFCCPHDCGAMSGTGGAGANRGGVAGPTAGPGWRSMHYVKDAAGLRRMAAELKDAPLIAVDTEAAGYHRYHDRICLVQLSDRSRNYLIDTLAVTGLDGVGPLLQDPAVETVFHDADYDLRLLARDFGGRVRNLVDTMLAAQLLGVPAFGLGALVEKYLGVTMDKKHQRADWAQRPLPPDLLEYAVDDTRYLPNLRDRLHAELARRGRWHWAEEEFRLREAATRESPAADGDAYLKLKNTRDLTPRQLAALRALHAWREGLARKRDIAPFRVAGNDVLVAIARALPQDRTALADTPDVPASIADRYPAEFLGAVAEALSLPADQLPTRKRGPARPLPDPEFDRL
ncbi:MAG: ribonuclease D, partial [Gemmatimonadetes bacterium]|nr:ribonuclease D [Gemmatimonadota bacterium]